MQPAAVAGLSAAAAVCLILALAFYFLGSRWEERARAVDGVVKVSPAANKRDGPTVASRRADSGCSRCSRCERGVDPQHERTIPAIKLDAPARDSRSMGGQERPQERGAKLDCVQVFSPPSSRSYVQPSLVLIAQGTLCRRNFAGMCTKRMAGQTSRQVRRNVQGSAGETPATINVAPVQSGQRSRAMADAWQRDEEAGACARRSSCAAVPSGKPWDTVVALDVPRVCRCLSVGFHGVASLVAPRVADQHQPCHMGA